MKLVELMSGTNEKCPESLQHIEVSGVACNSQKIKPGDAFLCIKGYQSDGHFYAKDAAQRGASVIISEKFPKDLEGLSERVPVLQVQNSRPLLSKISANFYGNPSTGIQVAGVTGTNGKTTITYMMQKIWEAEGLSSGVLGTNGYRYGEKFYEAANTTPESCDLQAMFREMREEKIDYCAMEVSSHALALGRVADIHFRWGIFTNLTPDHMDFHQDEEDYFAAKKQLFYLTEQANMINVDDPYGKRLYDQLVRERKSVTTLSYSLLDRQANYFGEVEEANARGSVLRVTESTGNGCYEEFLRLRTPGVFTLYNGLAALACARSAGISFPVIRKGLEELKGVPGRFEVVENTGNFTVIVDYAHTPDALEKVLKTANEFKTGRLICVFGCGGDRDPKKRPLMGAVVGTHSDLAIITSDNPRSENQTLIGAEVEAGIKGKNCKYELIENRHDAIKKAVSLGQKGDIILIAGKGHETYQIIGKQKFHFDDREVVKKIIENGE